MPPESSPISATDHDPERCWTSRSQPVAEDMDLQRKTWKFERCGWVALTGVIALAVLGCFANGPVSSTSAADASGRLRVVYERLQRAGVPTRLELRIASGAQDPVAVHLSEAFVRSFHIEAVHPEPASQHARKNGVEMVFHPARDGTPTVRLAVRPRGLWLSSSEVGLAGEGPVRLTHFVFP